MIGIPSEKNLYHLDMTLLQRTIRLMESFAPLSLAESWDNVGLLIEAPYPRSGSKILLTIDLTPQVMEEAIQNSSVSMIISYHPPLFSSFKRLTMKDVKQSIALQCIGSGISVYSPHSALDSCEDGINDWLASGLGKGVSASITPVNLDSQPNAGVGRLFTLEDSVSVDEITNRIKKHLGLSHLRRASAIGTPSVRTIAICAGSGNSVVSRVNADLYFTGEMGHHDVLAAVSRGSNVILCEHTNTERGYLKHVLQPKLTKLLRKENIDAEVLCSVSDEDPLKIV
jgi:dinuclear metal center YbgI/SA1388 family protein